VLKAAGWDQEVAFELHYAQQGGARGGSAGSRVRRLFATLAATPTAFAAFFFAVASAR
jgi:hypothetical protein